ncbi:hypothetical protein A5662_02690 [Mycobacteriaceae bacterium 1482268.1]|nr:hypothetical protein A5662_02690 [Mycobacteriaceae bacterium 1482268.1]
MCDRRMGAIVTRPQVHLLDVGTESYGDCLVLEFPGDGQPTRVLVDGGHRSDKARLIKQFTDIFGHTAPFQFDLILISHAHDDHIGAIPDLVRDGRLRADHALIPDSDMAFGPISDDGIDAATDAAMQAVALLREEPPDDAVAADALELMALDAASLRSRYDEMQETLNEQGTNVVLFGSSSTAKLQKLQKNFAHVGLKILGPARPALDRTAQLLTGAARQIIDDARALQDAGRDSADLLTALDAQKRIGNIVNAQSAVCRFAVETASGTRKILLAGDFQFAALGSSDATLVAERDRLLKAIAKEAPYAFVKLSHHGSDNAVNTKFLDAIGATDVLGICCGRGHPAHPDPETLKLLKTRGDTTWIRTDRSGHLTVSIEANDVDINPDDKLNDAKPNAADAGAVSGTGSPGLPAVIGAAPVVRTPVTQRAPAAGTPGAPPSAAPDSMRFDIPARASSVTIRLDLVPQPATTAAASSAPAEPGMPSSAAGASSAPTTSDKPQHGGSGQKRFEIGGGRPLPPLIFLTDTRRLANHTAPNVVTMIIDAINYGGHRLCDVDTAGAVSTVDDIAAVLRTHIDAQPNSQVVILGGYDVIPSQQVDAISPETPADTMDSLRISDPDGFYVWSDDVYADVDDAGLPDLPISRIPDGHDSLFTLNALQAGPSAGPARMGIRNSVRKFVAPIYDSLPGTNALLVSGPLDSANLHAGQFVGSYVYYMLHGDDRDAKRFWGEEPRGNLVEAVTLGQVPTDGVDVAVLGCCWGALPASTKAADWSPGQPITGRLAGQSIALTLLAAGARAVIGCTGAHYSPTQPPYDTASGPFHKALWRGIVAGKTPAAALQAAKYDFSSRLTTVTDANELAIAYKTLGQFTCLGLGC